MIWNEGIGLSKGTETMLDLAIELDQRQPHVNFAVAGDHELHKAEGYFLECGRYPLALAVVPVAAHPIRRDRFA